MFKFKQKIRQLLYQIRHQWLVPQNLFLLAVVIVAIVCVLSATSTMQRNYELQKRVDTKKQQLALLELEASLTEIELEYYRTEEYQDLIARQSLGLATSGEKVLILPQYSDWVRQKQAEQKEQADTTLTEASNFQQWINFLFGANRH